MKTEKIAEIARTMLRGVRLDNLIGPESPTLECWERLASGTLSTTERVLLSLAVSMLDYGPVEDVTVDQLMKLDAASMERVGDALLALADLRGGEGRRVIITHRSSSYR